MPTSKLKEVAAMLKAIHAQEDRTAATEAEQVAVKLNDMKLADAGAIVAAGTQEALYYYAFRSARVLAVAADEPR